MNIRHASFLFAVILIVPGAHASDRKHLWFEGMSHPPLLTPALPTDFIVVSLWPKTKKTKEFNMEAGVIWAPERTAHHFEFGADDNIANAKEPLFYVRLSETVSQVPGTDRFKNEENMVAALTSSGVKNVKSSKTKWGNYPVLVLTGQAKSGLAMFTAFLGINSPDGWVIAVIYRVPTAKGHPTDEEKKIWERFLNETKP